jgi:hypothetical protein
MIISTACLWSNWYGASLTGTSLTSKSFIYMHYKREWLSEKIISHQRQLSFVIIFTPSN